jgi:hypothetical protein
MYPTIKKGEFVLSDPNYYRHHAPAVGDVVNVRAANHIYYHDDALRDHMRRIRAVADDGVWVSADSYKDVDVSNANIYINVKVPMSEVAGLFTYIVLSDDPKRIGAKISDLPPPAYEPFDFTK